MADHWSRNLHTVPLCPFTTSASRIPFAILWLIHVYLSYAGFRIVPQLLLYSYHSELSASSGPPLILYIPYAFSDYLLDLGAFNVPVLLCVVLDCPIRAELAHLFYGLLKVAPLLYLL